MKINIYQALINFWGEDYTQLGNQNNFLMKISVGFYLFILNVIKRIECETIIKPDKKRLKFKFITFYKVRISQNIRIKALYSMSSLYKHQPKSSETFSRSSAVESRYKSNHKVLNSLKEEMCHIRESMSRMIRPKDGKGLKVVSRSALNQQVENEVNPSESKDEIQRNRKNLENKFAKQSKEMQILQQENQHLKAKIKELQQAKAAQELHHQNKQLELIAHNQSLQEHLKILNKQLKSLENQRAHRRNSVHQIKQPETKSIVDQFLNPELKKIPEPTVESHTEIAKKNNRHMSAQIKKLHQKTKLLELLSTNQTNLIKTLNEKIIQDSLQKISEKYYQHE